MSAYGRRATQSPNDGVIGSPLLPVDAERTSRTSTAAAFDAEDKQRRLMPTWWLFFIGTFWFPQFVGFVLVPNILLPVQVANLVGPNGEGAALGLVNMLIQLSGFTQPFIGAWSDRSQSRWGKRRPFILLGQLGVLISLYMMMVAEDMFMLSLGNFLFSAFNNVPTTVYAAVIPELVAPEQRGLASGFQNLMMLGGGLAGNGIGYLTGIGAVTQSAAYMILIALNVVDIPLGMMGVGVSPGWWSPERRPPPSTWQMDAPAVVARFQPRGRRSWLRSAWETLADFLGPFWRKGASSFRWWFGYTVLFQSSLVVGQTFLLYWLQDEVIPNGYLFFGKDLISSASQVVGGSDSGSGSTLGNQAQAALALAGVVGSIGSTATSVVGGLGPCDRSRRLVIGGTALLTGVSAALMALTHSFGVFLILSALNGVLTGLAAAPTAALTADVLPSEADDATTAADPARDANLFTLAGTLPSTVLPLVGNALPGANHPQQRAKVYRGFFWTQAALSIGSIWMLAWVDPWAERSKLAVVEGRDLAQQSRRRYGRSGGYGEVPTDYSKAHTVRARGQYRS